MSTEVRKVTVKDGGQMVRWLNELEYIEGEIWANVYQVHCAVCWLICVSDSAIEQVTLVYLFYNIR